MTDDKLDAIAQAYTNKAMQDYADKDSLEFNCLVDAHFEAFKAGFLACKEDQADAEVLVKALERINDVAWGSASLDDLTGFQVIFDESKAALKEYREGK